MADKPRAESAIDESLVRHLLLTQARTIERVDQLPLQHAEDGWDCSVWRLGKQLAVRLPRRALAAPLIEHEQRHLPEIAARLAPMLVPVPIIAGVPDGRFPWRWSVVPWLAGESGLAVACTQRSGWVEPLARALLALHVPASGSFPTNPYRGVPLAQRSSAIRERLATAGLVSPGVAAALGKIWQRGVAVHGWGRSPVWIHGDLHPGNLIARGSELRGIIDFGDLTAGDPAYDLAVAWLAFDSSGRTRFRAALDGHYDAATWIRAHAWAVAMTLALLQHSDDNPAYLTLAEECLAAVLAFEVN